MMPGPRPRKRDRRCYIVSMPDRCVDRVEDVTSVAVGSGNPVKIAAVRAVIASFAPNAKIESALVASGVPDQPWGDDETIRGATTRARAAREARDADIGVGIEGGVVEAPDGSVRTCAWAVVVDRDGRSGVGGSLALPVPTHVASLLRDGVELGHAMDIVSGSSNTKQRVGAVGLLTRGRIDRQRAYEIILTYALVPWLSESDEPRP
jgi:inosine/xanthosine triphosphatase